MDKKKVVGAVVIGALALAYGVSPIDFIPDVALPVGLADDATAIVAAVVVIARLVSSAKKPKTPTV